MGTARAVTLRGMSRACSGAITAGLAVLLVLLLGSWVAATISGTPRPGDTILLGHVVAAALALALQRVADRRADRIGLAAALGVLVVAVVLGAAFWWG